MEFLSSISLRSGAQLPRVVSGYHIGPPRQRPFSLLENFHLDFAVLDAVSSADREFYRIGCLKRERRMDFVLHVVQFWVDL